MTVRQDVRCVQQLPVPQPADTARLSIREQYPFAEGLLVESSLHKCCDIPPPRICPRTAAPAGPQTEIRAPTVRAATPFHAAPPAGARTRTLARELWCPNQDRQHS